ncbi:hypothetical protein COHA_006978 [Chlorella ohadii]|uniref:Staygreen protein domain-containing protein n=1 Tax=Chlorella ohadii TaxID=2649997 RepID=A0AAD5DP10_9CHLO|nr:hypothetical protein COHA_006978 [Chlorella ohadii]
MAFALGLSSSGACPGPTCSSSAGSSLLAGWQGASLRAACLAPWRCTRTAPRRRRQQPLRAALLDPPAFDPAKLRVEYLPGAREPGLAAGRRYTLTHNDVTGSLQLSIGREYNQAQLSDWYTRMLRDEILAEWRDTAAPVRGSSSSGAGSSSDGEGGGWRSAPQPSLHIYCHVSGEELWPAPPALRSFIFQREMTLVLDTIMHAERDILLAAQQQAQQQPQQLGEQQQQPGVAPGSSSNGASAEHPAPGDSAACSASSNGSSSNGSSISSGSGSPAAANSAVSLASVQQAGDYPSWLGAAAVVADGRRRPAAEVVPAAVRARQR